MSSKRPLKRKNSVGMPSSIGVGLKQTFSRHFFNIGLIEQRVRSQQSNSGLAMNCVTGKYEFDPELCTVRTDDEMVDAVRSLGRQPKFGSSVFSSMEPDPDEKDATVLAEWRACNQQFDQMYNNNNNSKNKENAGKGIVKANNKSSSSSGRPIRNKKKPFSQWAMNAPTAKKQ